MRQEKSTAFQSGKMNVEIAPGFWHFESETDQRDCGNADMT
jgi:hypothetical protein